MSQLVLSCKDYSFPSSVFSMGKWAVSCWWFSHLLSLQHIQISLEKSFPPKWRVGVHLDHTVCLLRTISLRRQLFFVPREGGKEVETMMIGELICMFHFFLPLHSRSMNKELSPEALLPLCSFMLLIWSEPDHISWNLCFLQSWLLIPDTEMAGATDSLSLQHHHLQHNRGGWSFASHLTHHPQTLEKYWVLSGRSQTMDFLSITSAWLLTPISC